MATSCVTSTSPLGNIVSWQHCIVCHVNIALQQHCFVVVIFIVVDVIVVTVIVTVKYTDLAIFQRLYFCAGSLPVIAELYFGGSEYKVQC